MPLCTLLLRFLFIEMSWKDAQVFKSRKRGVICHLYITLDRWYRLLRLETSFRGNIKNKNTQRLLSLAVNG